MPHRLNLEQFPLTSDGREAEQIETPLGEEVPYFDQRSNGRLSFDGVWESLSDHFQPNRQLDSAAQRIDVVAVPHP